jgi:hypothetical protein
MSKRPPAIRLKRTRTQIPSGYVVGRIDKGTGDEQLIPFHQVGDAIAASGSNISGSSKKSRHPSLGFYLQGPFAENQVFPLARGDMAVKFPSAAATEVDFATCEFASIADYTFYVTDDYAAFLAVGTHLIATIVFLAGQKTGTVTWNGSFTTTPGEILYAVMKHAVDATLAEVEILLVGDNV